MGVYSSRNKVINIPIQKREKLNCLRTATHWLIWIHGQKKVMLQEVKIQRGLFGADLVRGKIVS
uniref:Uncharacterized protein n=1 Tax=Anguilla anguilla TaxID=7936 RepID=A0A0E9P9M6_ANGAN